jgi:hypothetical protein
MRWRAGPDLNDLPRPQAGVRDRASVRLVGGLRVGRRCPPQAAGLRCLLGGCDQMRDKNRTRPRQRSDRSLRPLRRGDRGHQRNAGRGCVRKGALIQGLLWSATA